MKREELLKKSKPILFNTEMVRAILDGRKTVTRRLVKDGKSTPKCHGKDKFYDIVDHLNDDYKHWYAGFYNDNNIFYIDGKKIIDAIYFQAPYKPGDILYIRETFVQPARHIFWYKADENSWLNSKNMRWKPSIHMPKEAARIFLKVTDVRVERLQDMNGRDVLKEGVNSLVHTDAFYFDMNQLDMFERLWNSTIKKSDLDTYGWDANPWVWVIEFKRIEV